MPHVSEAVRERPVLIGAPLPLAGILSEPTGGTDARATAILLNPGILHRVGASRMNVTVGRALAAAGFRALRFDFSGIGDSETRPASGAFSSRSVDEVREVMDYLAGADLGRDFVVGGLCSGADVAYHTALADPRVQGIVCIDGHAFRTWRYWLHRYAPRLLRGESWKNLLTGKTYVGPLLRSLLGRNGSAEEVDEVEVFRRPIEPADEVAEGYRALVDRGVYMLQVFTGGIEGHYNYAGQFRDAFAAVDFDDRLTLEYFARSDHTFTRLEDRERLVALVRSWLLERWRARESARERRTPARDGKLIGRV